MDLDEFVTRTLLNIARGVKGAHAGAAGLGGVVSPEREYGMRTNSADRV